MRAGSNWRHLNGLSLGMMGDPVRCLLKVVHPDVAALKLQHNRPEDSAARIQVAKRVYPELYPVLVRNEAFRYESGVWLDSQGGRDPTKQNHSVRRLAERPRRNC